MVRTDQMRMLRLPVPMRVGHIDDLSVVLDSFIRIFAPVLRKITARLCGFRTVTVSER